MVDPIANASDSTSKLSVFVEDAVFSFYSRHINSDTIVDSGLDIWAKSPSHGGQQSGSNAVLHRPHGMSLYLSSCAG